MQLTYVPGSSCGPMPRQVVRHHSSVVGPAEQGGRPHVVLREIPLVRLHAGDIAEFDHDELRVLGVELEHLLVVVVVPKLIDIYTE